MDSGEAAWRTAVLHADASYQAAKEAANATRDAAASQAAATMQAADNHADAVRESAQINKDAQCESAQIQVDGMIAVEGLRMGVQQGIATTAAEAQKYVAEQNREASNYRADQDKEGQVDSADKSAQAQVDAAIARADADKEVAQTQADGARDVANTNLEGDTIQANASVTAAEAQARATEAAANARANADVQVAGIQSTASTTVAAVNKDASNYSADTQLSGVNVRETAETRRLDIKLGWANARWAEIFPLVRDALERDGQVGGSGVPWASLIAAVGPAPAITVMGALTPQQVRQQVNALYARADARASSAIVRDEQDLAGRGFASSSPVLAMLRQSRQAAASREAVEGEVDLTTKVAQANAELLLRGQEAANEQYGRLMSAYTDLNGDMVQLRVGLFSGAANLLSGIV
jgi:hypothetical protein